MSVALILPSILGPLLMVFWSNFRIMLNERYAISPDIIEFGTSTFISDWLVWIYVSVIFIGFQSFFYSMIMEFIVRPRIQSRTLYLLSSILLGVLVGLSLFFIVGFNFELPVIGALTGFITGLIIYKADYVGPTA